ncbi:Type IV fimbrial biogeneis protein PilW [Candidatus Burkholderia humilis]|nr:Type IV fimbrial biogeneis protein PilW [Candidatus Burkholderia humilis]
MNTRPLKPRDHTLLELTIALAFGMLIVIAALMLYRSQRASFERAADAARIHDATAVALDIIVAQIQMAGFGASAVDAPLFGCAQGRGSPGNPAIGPKTATSKLNTSRTRFISRNTAAWRACRRSCCRPP